MRVKKYEQARILIVDDEEPNVALLEAVLERAGYTNVTSLTDPRLVEDDVAAREPDLILLDLMMPRVDGFSVMKRLGEILPEDAYLPILVLTAAATREARERALFEGAMDFLTKPFDHAEVLLRVRNLLHTRQLHQDIRNHNKLLEQGVRDRTRKLEKAQVEILERLALLTEYRDDATRQHTVRVGDLSAQIARRLGMPEDETDMLRLAAQLHDLGKAGLADALLLKPGKFTEEEREVMKAHTTIGANILSNGQSRLLQLAEEIALSHHERWAGGGYPHGLVGEAIPLSGRIVAVADVFDALTHDRPYKKEWTVDQAIAEIVRLSGEQFDPYVVEAFLRVLTPETEMEEYKLAA